MTESSSQAFAGCMDVVKLFNQILLLKRNLDLGLQQSNLDIGPCCIIFDDLDPTGSFKLFEGLPSHRLLS